MQQKPRLSECIERLQQMEHYSDTDFQKLIDLVGEGYLAQRLSRQLELYDRQFRERDGLDIRLQRLLVPGILEFGLRCTGLLKRAKRNARMPMVETNEVFLEGLPVAFDGCRILHLGDFHFDYMPDLPELLVKALAPLHFDLCVLTGDFRGETTGPYQESVSCLSACRDAFGEEVYSVLGNHDNIEFAIELEELGIRPLMNQSTSLIRGGSLLTLCGVDDAYFYKTFKLDGLGVSPRDDVSILLSHTPEICHEAERMGFSAMWCGHTHGGQMCLPGGIPILTHLGGAPRRCVKGAWTLGQMQGYTTRGIGCSSLDVRFNCPPEITIHVLRRGNPEN